MSAAVVSMTGFAQAKRAFATGELLMSMRAVNGRGLDLHINLPFELSGLENELRTLLRGRLFRGNVEVRASWIPAGRNGAAAFRVDRLRQYVEGFQAAASELHLTVEPDLNRLLSLPGVVADGGAPGELPSTELLLDVAGACIEELKVVREREGDLLRAAMQQELGVMEASLRTMAVQRESAIEKNRERLHERLAKLLGSMPISEARLLEEVAVLADRSEIAEELTRLVIHQKELRELMEAGGAVGKRIDFLMQEINREINTILSKSSALGEAGLPLTASGLACKGAADKIREQAANLE